MVRWTCAGTTVSLSASAITAPTLAGKRAPALARRSARGRAVGLALLAMAFPTLAHATTGLLCTPITGAGPKFSLMVGAEGIIGGALFERGRWLSSMEHKNAPFTIVQRSINQREARLDLVSRGASRSKVRLRVRMLPLHPPGIEASGTLQRLGRTYRVNCVQD